MKVLRDSCVWSGAAAGLQRASHDIEQVRDWPADPGDAQILLHARHSAAVLVTIDKDFGELAVHRGMRHTGIIRRVDISAVLQGPAACEALAKYAAELSAGAIVTVTPGRVRIRPAEPDAPD